MQNPVPSEYVFFYIIFLLNADSVYSYFILSVRLSLSRAIFEVVKQKGFLCCVTEFKNLWIDFDEVFCWKLLLVLSALCCAVFDRTASKAGIHELKI